jgi:tetratricopeptide (TPR) repeat protein
MCCVSRPYALMFALALIPGLLIACRAKPTPVVAPVSGPDVRAQARELVARGDAHFEDSHLYGWRQAEALYRKAYELEKSETTREKLLLTRFLIETRQSDEDIPGAVGESTLQTLCTNPLTDKQKVLCSLAPRYIAGPGDRAPQQSEHIDKTLFDLDQSSLDAYLYTLCARTYGIKEPTEDVNARRDKFANSPLFIYLDLAKQVARKGAELEKSYPQFAELYVQMGETQFQGTRYSGARIYFKRALDLIPDFTRAINGLGNIYLFALEDYDMALQLYESALTWDPPNTAALYGKGTVLHILGKYQESNATLDTMLQSDLSRRGRASAQAVRYYQGEGIFYKAYNYHLMGDSAKARELVDTAKRYIPASDSVNYLSGLLYYQSKQYQPARDDFMRVLQSGLPNCDAQYYLGLIYREWEDAPVEKPQVVKLPEALAKNRELEKSFNKMPAIVDSRERRAVSYFLGSCSCMDATVRNMKQRIESLPSLDIEDAEKIVLKGRLEKKLFSYRVTAISLVEGMMEMASDADIPNKKVYIDLMNEILGHVRPPSEKP